MVFTFGKGLRFSSWISQARLTAPFCSEPKASEVLTSTHTSPHTLQYVAEVTSCNTLSHAVSGKTKKPLLEFVRVDKLVKKNLL